MTEPNFSTPKRIRIDLDRSRFQTGEITHDGKQARVVMNRRVICVGCTDVTIDALEWLLTEHRNRFGVQESYEVQRGEKPC